MTTTDDTAALAYFRARIDSALRIAVKPEYDIHVRCPACSKEVTVDNGEWILWCGEEEGAQALLAAARILSRLIERMPPEESTERLYGARYSTVSGRKSMRAEIINIIREAMAGER